MHAKTSATALHHELRSTLEEASHCYTLMIEAGEHPNLDRMGYASQITLDIFRRLLNRPDLQAEELAATLRESLTLQQEAHAHRLTRVPRPVQADSAALHWQDITVRFLTQRANEN